MACWVDWTKNDFQKMSFSNSKQAAELNETQLLVLKNTTPKLQLVQFGHCLKKPNKACIY